MNKLIAALLTITVLTIAIVVFTQTKYQPFKLVLLTKTLEKGTRYIDVENADDNTFSRIKFEIGNDKGDSSFYALELPRIKVNSLKIPPLAIIGKYQIDGITLSNDSVSYSWDEQMACSQQQHGSPLKQPCGNAPTISVGADSSIVISSIPANGTANTWQLRVVLAVVSALVAIICAAFLFRPVTGKDRLLCYTARAAWLAFALLFFYQLYLLGNYSVDIPNFEEWEFFEPFALPEGITWQWLSRPVSHQRLMLFTKLTAWLNFKLFDLDFVKLKFFNYIFFGMFLLLIFKFKNKVIGSDRFVLFPFFMIFMLSPIIYEVHAASFQSGEVFVLLFSFAALLYAIREDNSFTSAIFFSLFVILAMSSLSAGVVFATVLLLCRTAFVVAKVIQEANNRRATLYNLFVTWLLGISALGIWLSGFKKPANTPPWLFPTEAKFWDAFLNLLSFGFGFEIENPVPGLICLVFVLFPVTLLLWRKSTRWHISTWQVIAATLSIVGLVALITVGRGNMAGSIKVSRYVLFSILLIPVSSMAWWLALTDKTSRCLTLALFWLFCAAAFYNDWDYTIFRDIQQQDTFNLECIELYNNGTGDGNCPGTHFRPIGSYFDNAKRLDVKFTRQFRLSSNRN